MENRGFQLSLGQTAQFWGYPADVGGPFGERFVLRDMGMQLMVPTGRTGIRAC